MTTSKAADRAARYGPVDEDFGGARTIRAALGYACNERAQELGSGPEWPMVRYQRDPLGFFRDILGVRLMVEQEEIALGVMHYTLVAISGGRKVGKDFVVACVALWYWACFDKARVLFTAVTEEQASRIFWYQVVDLVNASGRCLECKRLHSGGPVPCPHSQVLYDGAPPLGCRIGLKRGGHELFGFTVAEAAAIRGISGVNQFYIVDEASHANDRQIATFISNIQGSTFGRVCLLSNPACDSGQFYRAFHEERHLWKTFERSSLEIAKKYGGKIPGIALVENIQREIELHGADSDYVAWNIHGRFVNREVGEIFSREAIKAAVGRRDDAKAEGPLVIGVDVAGESGTGDESAFSAMRGLRQLSLHTRRGLSGDGHVKEVVGLIAANPEPHQEVAVVVDRGGEAGAKAWGAFLAYRRLHEDRPPFRLIGVDSSDKACRDPKAYERVRDELVASMADWMRDGGGIVDDAMLHAELYELRWIEQRIKNVNRLIDKKALRQKLQRSPDRADATALSVWYRRRYRAATADTPAAPAPAPDVQQANEIWYGPPPGGDDEKSPWWPD